MVKRAHQTYDRFKNDPYFNQILTDLSTEKRLKRGTLTGIASESGTHWETLRTWRKKLKRNKEYKPFHKKPKEIRHVTTVTLPKEVMEQLLATLDEDYLSRNRYCPPTVLDQMARSAAISAGIAKFKASST